VEGPSTGIVAKHGNCLLRSFCTKLEDGVQHNALKEKAAQYVHNDSLSLNMTSFRILSD
jgi:hypothetical protein